MSKYGRVFKVFDDQDSGNICFGTEKDGQRYFVKFAGAPTEQYNGKASDAVKRLQSSLPVYKDLRHENLIRLIKAWRYWRRICHGVPMGRWGLHGQDVPGGTPSVYAAAR